MKYIFILLLAICGLGSCQRDVTSNKAIAFNELTRCKMSEVVDFVSYMPIILPPETYYSEISKVVVVDEYILLGDYSNEKIIVLDRSAKFLYSLDKKGRANQEYLEVKSYCADNDYIYIIDNYKKELLVYNIADGSYHSSISMPIVAWDIECLGSTKFALAFSPLQEDEVNTHRLYITDKELNIIQKEFHYEKSSQDPIGKDSYFSKGPNGELVFHWCGSNSYFILEDSGREVSITVREVDFGQDSITDDIYEDFNEINKQKKNYIYGTPIIGQDYTLFDIVTHTYDGNFVYSEESNCLYMNSEDDSVYMPFPHSTVGEYFIHIMDSYEDYLWLKSIGFPATPTDVEHHIKEGGSIIIKYKLKGLTR